MDEVRADRLTRSLAERFAATLDRPGPVNHAPQGIHWCLATPEAATAWLGPDGHAAIDPDLPPRRMWASSEVRFLAPIPIERGIERRSRLLDRIEKQGSSGRLLFVTLEHVISVAGEPAIEETQTIVYREPAAITAPAPRPVFAGDLPPDGPWRRTIVPSPALLFRYSALTFNSHRIHYDLPYARDVEGYPGLVVHGPLMATLLLDLADRELGSNRLTRFAFRAQQPAFAGEPITLTGKRDGDVLALAVSNANGGTVMSANATIA
ncbi:FAS1-like dehydratase domain-containing protein [Sphingomonas oryzagri]